MELLNKNQTVLFFAIASAILLTMFIFFLVLVLVPRKIIDPTSIPRELLVQLKLSERLIAKEDEEMAEEKDSYELEEHSEEESKLVKKSAETCPITSVEKEFNMSIPENSRYLELILDKPVDDIDLNKEEIKYTKEEIMGRIEALEDLMKNDFEFEECLIFESRLLKSPEEIEEENNEIEGSSGEMSILCRWLNTLSRESAQLERIEKASAELTKVVNDKSNDYDNLVSNANRRKSLFVNDEYKQDKIQEANVLISKEEKAKAGALEVLNTLGTQFFQIKKHKGLIMNLRRLACVLAGAVNCSRRFLMMSLKLSCETEMIEYRRKALKHIKAAENLRDILIKIKYDISTDNTQKFFISILTSLENTILVKPVFTSSEFIEKKGHIQKMISMLHRSLAERIQIRPSVTMTRQYYKVKMMLEKKEAELMKLTNPYLIRLYQYEIGELKSELTWYDYDQVVRDFHSIKAILNQYKEEASLAISAHHEIIGKFKKKSAGMAKHKAFRNNLPAREISKDKSKLALIQSWFKEARRIDTLYDKDNLLTSIKEMNRRYDVLIKKIWRRWEKTYDLAYNTKEFEEGARNRGIKMEKEIIEMEKDYTPIQEVIFTPPVDKLPSAMKTKKDLTKKKMIKFDETEALEVIKEIQLMKEESKDEDSE